MGIMRKKVSTTITRICLCPWGGGRRSWKFVQQGMFPKNKFAVYLSDISIENQVDEKYFFWCCCVVVTCIDECFFWFYMLHVTEKLIHLWNVACFSHSLDSPTQGKHHLCSVLVSVEATDFFSNHKVRKQLSMRVMKVWLWRNTIFDRDYPWSIIKFSL